MIDMSHTGYGACNYPPGMDGWQCARIEYDRGCDDRSCERPAAGLVDAGNDDLRCPVCGLPPEIRHRFSWSRRRLPASVRFAAQSPHGVDSDR